MTTVGIVSNEVTTKCQLGINEVIFECQQPQQFRSEVTSVLDKWVAFRLDKNLKVLEDKDHGITINQEFLKLKIIYLHFGSEES